MTQAIQAEILDKLTKGYKVRCWKHYALVDHHGHFHKSINSRTVDKLFDESLIREDIFEADAMWRWRDVFKTTKAFDKLIMKKDKGRPWRPEYCPGCREVLRYRLEQEEGLCDDCRNRGLSTRGMMLVRSDNNG